MSAQANDVRAVVVRAGHGLQAWPRDRFKSLRSVFGHNNVVLMDRAAIDAALAQGRIERDMPTSCARDGLTPAQRRTIIAQEAAARLEQVFDILAASKGAWLSRTAICQVCADAGWQTTPNTIFKTGMILVNAGRAEHCRQSGKTGPAHCFRVVA